MSQLKALKKGAKKVVENERPKGLLSFFQKIPNSTGKAETTPVVLDISISSPGDEPKAIPEKSLDLTQSPTSVESTSPILLFPLFSAKKSQNEDQMELHGKIEFSEADIPMDPIDLEHVMSSVDEKESSCAVDLSGASPVPSPVKPRRTKVSREEPISDTEVEAKELTINLPQPPAEVDDGRRRSSRIKTLAVQQVVQQEEKRKQQEQEERDAEERKAKRKAALAVARKNRGEDSDNDNDSNKASTKVKKTKTMSSTFFVSKEEKARLALEEKERKTKQLQEEREALARKQAEEREQRIHEQMLRQKAENDERLKRANSQQSSSSSVEGTAAAILNPFFQMRAATKSNSNAISINLIDDGKCCDSDNNSFEMLSMINQYTGSDEWMIELLSYVPADEEIILEDRIIYDDEGDSEGKDEEIVIIDLSTKPQQQNCHAFLSPQEYHPVQSRDCLTDQHWRSLYVEYITQTSGTVKQNITNDKTIDLSEEESTTIATTTTTSAATAVTSLKLPIVQEDEDTAKFRTWIKAWISKKSTSLTTTTMTSSSREKPTRVTSLQDEDDEDVDELRDSDEEFSFQDVPSDDDEEDDGYGRRRRGRNSKDRRSSRTNASSANNNHNVVMTEELNNIYIMEGPIASGKTDLVYRCAKANGVDVIEVNTSQIRSGANIRRLLSEVGRTRNVAHKSRGGNSKGKEEEIEIFRLDMEDDDDNADDVVVENKSKSIMNKKSTTTKAKISPLTLILIDEVDIAFEEDVHFHAALMKLANTVKCPMVITAERIPAQFNDLYANFLYQTKPTLPYIMSYLHTTYPTMNMQGLLPLAITSFNDIRACKRSIELFTVGKHHIVTHCLNNTLSKSFGEWIASKHLAYTLLMDNEQKAAETTMTIENDHSSENPTPAQTIYYPIIYDIHPRIAMIGNQQQSNTKIMLHGKHFLQAKGHRARVEAENDDERDANLIATANIFVNGISCESSTILSDTELLFSLPEALSMPGIYTITLTLSFSSPKISSYMVSAAACGLTNSWIYLVDQPTILNVNQALLNIRNRTFANAKSLQAKSEWISTAYDTHDNKDSNNEETSALNKRKKLRKRKRIAGHLGSKKSKVARKLNNEDNNNGDGIEGGVDQEVIEIEDDEDDEDNDDDDDDDSDDIDEFSSDVEKEKETKGNVAKGRRISMLDSDDEEEKVNNNESFENEPENGDPNTSFNTITSEQQQDDDDANNNNLILISSSTTTTTCSPVASGMIILSEVEERKPLKEQLNDLLATRMTMDTNNLTVPGYEYTSDTACHILILPTTTTADLSDLEELSRLHNQLDHIGTVDLFAAYIEQTMDCEAEDEIYEDDTKYRYNRTLCMDRMQQYVGSVTQTIQQVYADHAALPSSSCLNKKKQKNIATTSLQDDHDLLLEQQQQQCQAEDGWKAYQAKKTLEHTQTNSLLHELHSPYLVYTYKHHCQRDVIYANYSLLAHQQQKLSHFPYSAWVIDLLPYISLLGRWSLIAEENEKLNMFVGKNNTTRNKRLSSTRSITTTSTTVEHFQYLQEIFELTEADIYSFMDYNQVLQIYPLL